MTTPGLGESISGAILYDETIRQQKRDGTPFVKVIIDAGIIPGIKVDTGAKDLAAHPGEKITEGLAGLRARLDTDTDSNFSSNCLATNFRANRNIRACNQRANTCAGIAGRSLCWHNDDVDGWRLAPLCSGR